MCSNDDKIVHLISVVGLVIRHNLCTKCFLFFSFLFLFDDRDRSELVAYACAKILLSLTQ